MAKRPTSTQSACASAMLQDMADRLRLLRSILVAVQADAARAAGVTPSTWNRYEMGTSRLDLIALVRFCDAYDVTTDFILRGSVAGLRAEVILRLIEAGWRQPGAAPGRSAEPAGHERDHSRGGVERRGRKAEAPAD